MKHKLDKFLMRQTRLTELASKYKSMDEILEDKNMSYYARASGMALDEFVNLLLKQMFTVNYILKQSVMIKIGDKKIKCDLNYEDFLIVRSGPKFSGYLNSEQGSEYLYDKKEENNKRLQYEAKCVLEVLRYAKAKNIKFLKKPFIYKNIKKQIETSKNKQLQAFFENLNQAASILLKPHKMQRRLTDYDLVASDLTPFVEAVKEEVKKMLGKDILEKDGSISLQNEALLQEVAITSWEIGGSIDLNLIKKAIKSEKISYRLEVEKKCKKKGKARYHVLQELNKNAVKALPEEYKKLLKEVKCTQADVALGYGIEFQGPTYKCKNGKLKIVLKDDVPVQIELGDVICDSSSYYAKYVNMKKLNKLSLKKIKSLCTKYNVEFKINDVEIVFEQLNKNKNKVFIKDLSNLLEEYKKNKLFVSSFSIFEEAAKKEAQLQSYKIHDKNSKMFGNILDITPFLKGAIEQKNDDLSVNAKAHLQLSMLTFLINVPRWGVEKNDFELIGNKAGFSFNDFKKFLINKKAAVVDARGNWQFLDSGSAQAIQKSKFYAYNMYNYYKKFINPKFCDVFEKNVELQGELENYQSYHRVYLDNLDKLNINSELYSKFLKKNVRGMKTCKKRIYKSLENVVTLQCPELLECMRNCDENFVIKDFLNELTEQIIKSSKFNANRLALRQDDNPLKVSENLSKKNVFVEKNASSVPNTAKKIISQPLRRSLSHPFSLYNIKKEQLKTTNITTKFITKLR